MCKEAGEKENPKTQQRVICQKYYAAFVSSTIGQVRRRALNMLQEIKTYHFQVKYFMLAFRIIEVNVCTQKKASEAAV